MKSIKTRLIINVLVLVFGSAVTIAAISVTQGLAISRSIIEVQFQDKLLSANNMLQVYLEEQFGSMYINSKGELVDEAGELIHGRYDYIDKLARNMGVVATVFAKEGSSFVRVLTTIKDDVGNRVIGTELDARGNAFKAILEGNSYFGEADILGKPYMTGYAPIHDNKGQIVGIYFAGMLLLPLHNVRR